MRHVIITAVTLLASAAFAQGDNKAPGKAVAAAKDAKPVDAPKPDAKVAAPMELPPPAKELADAMAPMEGTLKCTGKALDSPMGPGHAMDGTMTMKKDLDGYWFVGKFEEKKTKASPMPYSMWTTVGWDPSKKMLTRADFDNSGSVTHATSKGWEGDKLVFEGKITGGMPMGFRETTTKKGKELATVIEFSQGDTWFAGVEYTCKK